MYAIRSYYAPLGTSKDGAPVYLRDLWPGSDEIAAVLPYAQDPATFRRLYADFAKDAVLWNEISAREGQVYDWPESTYIALPPFFEGFGMAPPACQDSMPGREANKSLNIAYSRITSYNVCYTKLLRAARSSSAAAPPSTSLTSKPIRVANTAATLRLTGLSSQISIFRG